MKVDQLPTFKLLMIALTPAVSKAASKAASLEKTEGTTPLKVTVPWSTLTVTSSTFN
jgi:hypothetical protein